MIMSIVTTMYNSQNHLYEFYDRTLKALETLQCDLEIIFVDDGSPDDSIKIVQSIKRNDPRVKILKLSRNFGHHTALLAGIENSQGDYVFVIDSDLEERPEYLVDFWNVMKEDETLQMVYGIQFSRKGNNLEKLTGKFYYKIFNQLSSSKIEPNQLTARLMTRKFVNLLNQMQNKNFTFFQILSEVGLDSKSIQLEKLKLSRSNYSFRKKVSLVTRSLTTSSTKLLNSLFLLGFLVSSFLRLLSLIG